MMYCHHCGETFPEDEVATAWNRVGEYGERGYYEPESVCPYCGSWDITEEWRDENAREIRTE